MRFTPLLRKKNEVLIFYLILSFAVSRLSFFFFPLELWINGKLTDYAQAATKQNRIIPGGPTTDADESAAEIVKPNKASIQKKDNAQREVKDSAAQPPNYVKHNTCQNQCLLITDVLLFDNALDEHAQVVRFNDVRSMQGQPLPKRTVPLKEGRQELYMQMSSRLGRKILRFR